MREAKLQIDEEVVKQLYELAYYPKVHETYGSEGQAALTQLFNAIRLTYRECPPDGVLCSLVVTNSVNSSSHYSSIEGFGDVVSFSGYGELAVYVQETDSDMCCVVELADDDAFLALRLDAEPDLIEFSDGALVYGYQSGEEYILVAGDKISLKRISKSLKSNFAPPTLSGLEEAFTRYASTALHSRCEVLAGVWEGGVDGPRLVLVNKPESMMRDSLVRYLSFVIENASVRPEQNTDESHPVDIRVDWYGSSVSAIIEIKWLGRSTAKSRDPEAGVTFTEYGVARAQSGSQQLSDYLDREVRYNAANVLRGYLVVFDARRLNVQGSHDRLSEADAMHFSQSDIVYNPDYSAQRSDYAQSVRFFMTPRKSYFLAA